MKNKKPRLKMGGFLCLKQYDYKYRQFGTKKRKLNIGIDNIS